MINVSLKLIVSLDLIIHACKHLLDALHVLEIALVNHAFLPNYDLPLPIDILIYLGLISLVI